MHAVADMSATTTNMMTLNTLACYSRPLLRTASTLHNDGSFKTLFCSDKNRQPHFFLLMC